MAAQERQQERTLHRTTGRSAPESDKDSGFSDVASECLSSVEQTDSEEAPPTSQRPPGCPQPHPPSLLILKNLLVDQGCAPDPHPHPWTVRPSFQLLPAPSPILLFPPSLPSSKPRASREKSTKYLPILNSYPKIAPHPSQQQPPARGDKRGAESWRQNQTKRRLPGPPQSSTSEKGASVVGDMNDLDEVLTCPEQTDARDTSAADDGEARAGPCLQSAHKTDLSVPPQQEQNKNRRFQNTLDILHRSGLLTIAIRTKELLRLNQATQSQLERLQEQVSVYTRAATTNRPEDWQRLQELLAEGSGPIADVAM